jgi:Crp-like helix-turn-helix domain
LANFGKDEKPEPILAKISQETVADMIGTTRSRVSFFMNKFRKLGLIDYKGGIEVHSSLLTATNSTHRRQLRSLPNIKPEIHRLDVNGATHIDNVQWVSSIMRSSHGWCPGSIRKPAPLALKQLPHHIAVEPPLRQCGVF